MKNRPLLTTISTFGTVADRSGRKCGRLWTEIPGGSQRKPLKKNPFHRERGRQGWCLWQGKQGLLVTTGTAIATEKRRIQASLHPCNLTQLVHSLLMSGVQNRLLLGR